MSTTASQIPKGSRRGHSAGIRQYRHTGAEVEAEYEPLGTDPFDDRTERPVPRTVSRPTTIVETSAETSAGSDEASRSPASTEIASPSSLSAPKTSIDGGSPATASRSAT